MIRRSRLSLQQETSGNGRALITITPGHPRKVLRSAVDFGVSCVSVCQEVR
jgi:hypothetical protein